MLKNPFYFCNVMSFPVHQDIPLKKKDGQDLIHEEFIEWWKIQNKYKNKRYLYGFNARL